MAPIVQFAPSLLKLETFRTHQAVFEGILQAMFADYGQVVIERDLGGGTSFSGSWVFMVKRFPPNQQTSNRPVVVKIAAVSLIEKEWRAYRAYIEDRWPRSAEVKEAPVPSDDGTVAGLYYDFAGDGIYKIESLRQFCSRANVEAIRSLLTEELEPVFKEVLQKYHSQPYERRLRALYDPFLPINLWITPADPDDEETPTPITPDHRPEVPPGAPVRVSGFGVTKVDIKDRTVTLNLPRTGEALPEDAYTLRLKYDDETAIPSYNIGDKIEAVTGYISQTRWRQWQEEMAKVMAGQPFDIEAETVTLPDGPPLPNPFRAVESILNRSRVLKVGLIHGDLNMENILVRSGKDIRLIDFAEARLDHLLHDFLRLETETVTKLLPPIFQKYDLPLTTLFEFYRRLHQATLASPPQPNLSAPHPALERPFTLLHTLRTAARGRAFDRAEVALYYDCLTLYLLGALKFGNLDKMAEAPWPKRLAFWAAGVVRGLMQNPDLIRFIDLQENEEHPVSDWDKPTNRWLRAIWKYFSDSSE